MRPFAIPARLRPWLWFALGLGLATALFWNLSAMTDAIDHRAHADLPRFTELPAFDPYRQTFTCRHEALVNPAATPEAQVLFEEAMALDEYDLDPRTIDYKKVASLYRQAADLGHWKAQFNLAGLYLEGKGVPFDPNEALRLTEDLMTKGVPAAWFNMGNYYLSGVGPLKQDATVGYAFWQRAADMGSLHAQAELGKALDSDVDLSPRWANRAVGRQMLECAFAQGSGDAAYQLGISYENEAESQMDLAQRDTLNAKAVQRYHEGVKYGSQDCANAMFSEFSLGEAAVGHAKDPFRSKRYFAIADYLWHHPDTKLPNLDRVLPLPPAPLPTWDGEVESLIRAAQPVRVTPRLPDNPASHASGRAHMPEGHGLWIPPDYARYAERPILGYQDILTPGLSTGLARTNIDGYYQPWHFWATHPQARPPHTFDNEREHWRMQALQGVPPQYYRKGEKLDLSTAEPGEGRRHHWRLHDLFDSEGSHEWVYWHFMGQAVALRPLVDHLARAGQVRAIAQATDISCADGAPCPQTGIWQPEVMNGEHPLNRVYNGRLSGEAWRWQAFVLRGQPLPSLAERLAAVLQHEADGPPLDVRWQLMAACELGFEALKA